MRNRLDSFFKNKLDSQEFPFDESAWETISGELDKKEKDNKRPFYLWWGTGVIAVFALAFSTFFLYDFGVVSTNEISLNQKAEIESLTKAQAPILPVEKTNSSAAEIPLEKEIKSNTDLNSLNIIDEKIREKEIKANEVEPIFEETESKPNSIEQIEIIESETLAIISENIKAIPLLDLKEIDSRSFKYDFLRTSNPPSISPIKRFSNRPIKIGLILKGGLTASDFDSNVFGGGIFISKQINSRFSLSSGINYMHLNGEFDPIQNTTQKSYSFGSTTITNELTPNSLGILEVPLSFGYSLNRNQINFGLSSNYLIGVFGVKEVFESNLALPRINSEKGRITNTELPKWNLSFNLSVERNWKDFSYGLSGKYFQKNYFQIDDSPKKDLMIMEGFFKYRLF